MAIMAGLFRGRQTIDGGREGEVVGVLLTEKTGLMFWRCDYSNGRRNISCF